MRRLNILTWHVHGNYLYYLTQLPHEFLLVNDPSRPQHHSGRSGTLPFGGSTTIDGRRGLTGPSCTSQSAVLTAGPRGRCSSAVSRSNGVGS